MRRGSLLVLLFACAGARAQDTWQPGLVTASRDDSGLQILTVEPALALSLKAGQAPHPRLADNGTVRWEGLIKIEQAGDYRFAAQLRGKVRLLVDGKEVLAAEAMASQRVVGPTVMLQAGHQPLVVEFKRLPGAAHLQVLWQSSSFHEEPLAHPFLGHAMAPPRLKQDQLVDQGRFLAEERNCVRCHQPESKVGMGLAQRQGPDLSAIGARTYPGWLYRWLRQPRAVAGWAIMPDFFKDDDVGRTEAYAVARYLSSLGGPFEDKQRTDTEAAKRGAALFLRVGCVACHVQGKVPLAGLAHKSTPAKLARYLLDPLAIDPSGRMPAMLDSDSEANAVAHYLCQGDADPTLRALPPAPATALVETAFQRVDDRADEWKEFRKLPASAQWLDLGKRIVIDRGCNNCHEIAPGGQPFASVLAQKGLEELAAAKKPGCLGPEHDQRRPRFPLSSNERAAVRAFLADGLHGAGKPAPLHAARWSLKRFECLSCHERDGKGGLPADVLDGLRRAENADHVEAVAPPSLSGVGNKLRLSWLDEVLTKNARARPWFALRMPRYGKQNMTGLAEALASSCGAGPDQPLARPIFDKQADAAGKLLLGRDGFSCVVCHDHGPARGQVMRGPDLATMHLRVRYDWYRRWLEQPSRMQPGTRMPSVFPNGRSMLRHILDGDPDAQAKALWEHCLPSR